MAGTNKGKEDYPIQGGGSEPFLACTQLREQNRVVQHNTVYK